MARTESPPMPVGTPAPPFTLPDTRGNQPVAPRDFAGSPLLVVFMCNHCPFVVHLLDELVALAAELGTRGVRTVAISANDIAAYPQDGPLEMAALAEAKGFGFPTASTSRRTSPAPTRPSARRTSTSSTASTACSTAGSSTRPGPARVRRMAGTCARRPRRC